MDVESLHDDIPDLRLDEWSPTDNLARPGRCAGGRVCPLSADTSGAIEFGVLASGARRCEMNWRIRRYSGISIPHSLHTLIRQVFVSFILDAGQVSISDKGDAANSLYVIVAMGRSCRLRKVNAAGELAVLERGEFFGEIGVMSKQPRNATIEAIVDTKLLAIDRRVLWELIAKQPSVAKSILRFSARTTD